MSKRKKPHTLRNVILIAGVMAALAVGCEFGNRYITQMREDALAQRVAEVEAINQQREEVYQQQLADYQREHTTLENSAWPSAAATGWDIVDLTNYPLESPYTVNSTRAELMNEGLLLVNQWHSRPDDFSEEGLVSVGSYASKAIAVDNYSIRLFPQAIDALKALLDDAKEAGYEHFVVSEGYRSWDDQNELFQKRMQKLSSKYSGDELIEAAKKEVNYPGTSEYNTGLSFSLHLWEKGNSELNSKNYSTTEHAQWLAANCWKQGFVFRFPRYNFPLEGTLDKAYKTGVSISLNLYRYVGIGNAEIMHYMGLCLEEYIDYLAEHPHVAVFEDGKLKYEVWRQYVGDEKNITLQIPGKARTYESSLDNMGYVVTVCSY